jgi:hypothetical protein
MIMADNGEETWKAIKLVIFWFALGFLAMMCEGTH